MASLRFWEIFELVNCEKPWNYCQSSFIEDQYLVRTVFKSWMLVNVYYSEYNVFLEQCSAISCLLTFEQVRQHAFLLLNTKHLIYCVKNVKMVLQKLLLIYQNTSSVTFKLIFLKYNIRHRQHCERPT